VKAVQVTAFDTPAELTVAELDDPAPAAGEVVVDVTAAGVNFPDLLVTGGTYQRLPELPFVPGKELAGTVSAVGNEVERPHVGDRVAVQVEHGAFAQRVTVPAVNAVPVPDGVDDDVAAALGMGYLTAHFALFRRARLTAEERVLVTGANGDVGSAAVQLARRSGARVVAQVRSDRHVDRLRELGADTVVVGDAAGLRDGVLDATDGHGVDVVVETVGGDLFTQALRCVAWEGRLVVVGFAGGDVPTVKAGYLLVKNVSVLGLQVSDYRDREPAAVSAVQAELMDAVAAGDLEVPITARFPLADAGEALETVRRGGSLGKVVLTLG
jgi:NADPH:quinone reductase